MEVNKHEAFGIGALVVPAQNGMLKSLGHDVAALGQRALGLVVESRPQKCLVQFPDLKLSVWLGRDELADVEEQARHGLADYKRLIPMDLPADSPLVLWIWKLSKCLPVTHVLNIESGPLSDLWPDESDLLSDYYEGPADVSACYVALGVSELRLDDWHRAEALVKDRLLFARFLPAGMHKLEVALYFKT